MRAMIAAVYETKRSALCRGEVEARRLRLARWVALVGGAAVSAALMAGCGGGVTAGVGGAAAATQGRGISGVAHGGPNPIVGATINLYATSSGGYGAAPTLLGSATTDSGGYFSFVSPAACPAGQEAYVTGYGGDPGAGANANVLLMAALGSCSNVNSNTSIWMSEVTTVAAAYALGAFTVITGTASAPVVQVGAPAGNNAASGSCTVTAGTTTGCVSAGLAHAFANALNVANSVSVGGVGPTGAAYVVTPSNVDGEVPTAMIDSLANSVAACVNSRGGTAGDSSICGKLFSDATPPVAGAAAPTNTLQALMDVAANPALSAANVANIFGLATPQVSFFAPALTAAPADWSLGVVYTGVSVAGVNSAVASPFGLTLDANDQVYVSQAIGSPATSSQVLAMGANGAPLWASAGNTTYATPRTIASDTLGHVWMVNNGTTAAKGELLGFNTADGSSFKNVALGVAEPFGLAVDAENNLWFSVLSVAGQNLYELKQANSYGAVTFASAPGYSIQPYTVAIDANQNVWTANSASSGSSSVGVFPNTGTVSAPAYGGTAVTTSVTGASGAGLAVDASGNAWGATANGLVKLNATLSGAAVTSVGASYPGVSTTLPKYLSVDGAGSAWVPDQTAGALVEYNPLTQASEALRPCYGPGGATTCGVAITALKRAQVDSTGSVWIAGASTGVTQLIGSAAPAGSWSPAASGMGGGGSAAVSLSAGSLTFDSEVQGTSSAVQTVMLTNSGTATLTIASIALSGANATSFAQSNNCGATLAAGGFCTFAVTFVPAASGPLSASVVIADSAAGSPQSVGLSGTGVAGAAGLSLSPGTLNFNTIAVGTTSTAQTVTVTNSGSAPLTLTSVGVGGGSESSFGETNNCGSSLGVNGSCAVLVTFTPAAGGAQSANLTVTASSSNSPQSTTLAGNGNAGSTTSTFVNPLFSKADPSLALYNGLYYYVQSGCTHTGTQPVICVRAAASIPALATATAVPVFQMPAGDTYNQDVWAPQIENFGGSWYIQYASDAGGDHHLFAAVPGNESSPLTPYSWTVAPTGDPNGNGQLLTDWLSNNGIDPDVFQAHDGNYYLVYSCYQASGPQAQSICIAEMSDPNHLMVNPVNGKAVVEISFPTQVWENRSLAVQEGPFGFTHNGVDYVLYSCSFSGTADDYCTGMLENNSPPQVNGTGNPLLNPASWIKVGPVFDGHHASYGTGSVVLVNSPDYTELWNVYHGTDCLLSCDVSSGNTWPDRSVRAQKAAWSATGDLLLGYPVDITNTDGTGSDVPLAVPSTGGGGTMNEPAWGAAFGDAANGNPLGQVVGSWTATGTATISSSSLDANQLDQNFFESNPNYQNYILYTNLQQNAVGSGDANPGYGVYAAYVGHANFLSIMINPSSASCGTSGCVTTNAQINGVVQATQVCALPAGFSPAAVHNLVVQAVSGTYTIWLDGTPLAGACQGLTYSLIDGQESNHGTNGQVGVLVENTEATFTNFTVSPGVPLDSAAYAEAAAGNPAQTYALRNLASQMDLDNSCDGGCNGADSDGVAVIQYPTTTTFPLDFGVRQLWTLSAQGNGYFTLTNVLSGKCLEDPFGNAMPSRTLPQAQGVSTMAWQVSCNGSSQQNWKFVPLPVGSSFLLLNQASGLALDSYDTNQGTQTWLNTATGSAAQTWQLVIQ